MSVWRRFPWMLVLAAAARAQEPTDDPAKRVAEAAATFAKGDLAAAKRLLDEILAAGGLHGQVAVEANSLMGQCQQGLRDHEGACRSYRQTLRLLESIHGDADRDDIGAALNNLAVSLGAIGRPAEAEVIYRRVLGMTRRLHPEGHDNLVAVLKGYGDCLSAVGRPVEALAYLEEAVAIARRLQSSQLDVALNSYSLCLSDLDRPRDALPLLRESLEIKRRRFAGPSRQVAVALNNLAICLLRLGEHAESLELQTEALVMLDKADPTSEGLILIRANRAVCLRRLGQTSEAVDVARGALAAARARYPEPHVMTARAWLELSRCLLDFGGITEARQCADTAVAMLRSLHPGDHPDTAEALSVAGVAACFVGDEAHSVPLLEEAIAMRRRIAGSDGVAGEYLGNLALCLRRFGRTEDALRVCREGLALTEKRCGPGHPEIAVALMNLGEALVAAGRPAEALAQCERALAITRDALPRDHPQRCLILMSLGTCLKQLGRPADALAYYREAYDLAGRIFPAGHQARAAAAGNLAICLTDQRQDQEALPYYEEALSETGDDGLARSAGLSCRSISLRRLGHWAEAVADSERAVAILRAHYGRPHPELANALNSLGICLAGAGRRDEAMTALEEAVTIGRSFGAARTHWLATNLAHLYRVAGRRDDAVRLLEEAIGQIEGRRAEAMGLDGIDRASYDAWLRANAFDLMVRTLAEVGDGARALDYVERGRARAFLDLLQRSSVDPLREALEDARRREDSTLVKQIEEAAALAESRGVEVSRLGHAVALVRGRRDLPDEERARQVEDLLKQLAEANRLHGEALRVRAQLVGDHVPLATPEPLDTIRRLVGRDERLLAYAVDGDGAFLLLVPPSPGEIRVFPLSWPDGGPVTLPTLAAAVDGYVEALVAEGRASRARGVARPLEASPDSRRVAELSARLFAALLPAKAWAEIRECARVYLVPHGPLHRLPFEALLAGGSHWIDAGPPVCYIPSASGLAWCRRRRDRQEARRPRFEAVAAGDCIFARETEKIDWPAEGVLVVSVKPDAPGARAGLLSGDVMVSYDGVSTPDYPSFRQAHHKAKCEVEDRVRKPAEIEIVLLRRGERLTLRVPAGVLGIELAPEPPPQGAARLARRDPEQETVALERGALASRYGALAPLPGSRREVLAVAEALRERGETVVLLGEDATEAALFAAAPQARYLHLATHLVADEVEVASYTSLALTLPAAPTREDDGFLRLADLLERWRGRVSGCELVVLSACETAKGPAQKDEAVLALPLGFLYAGSPAVIASLWRVDDQSTADLFADFYGKIGGSGGTEKLRAFRDARKALKERYPEPYFWAPFVYVGDPR